MLAIPIEGKVRENGITLCARTRKAVQSPKFGLAAAPQREIGGEALRFRSGMVCA
jgi:hypothetical protein